MSTLIGEENKSSFTPAPWWVEDRRPGGVLQIQAKHRGEGSSYCIASVNLWEAPEANARLIAAAPELLAACKALMPEGWDAGHMDHMPGIQLAREAIAKAEGRS